ncbi:MAG: alpha-glucan family phosphorylase [Deltaproteobacteria bacterium]|nr:alpha-glucan family phosphorylase [Deltaproteobacteria bacterium]
MRPVRSYLVHPNLPEKLRALEKLALNLRWSWDHETISLFRRIDSALWEKTEHNPVRILQTAPQERLDELARDEAFLAHMERVQSSLDLYMAGNNTWYSRTHGKADRPLVAYFSMEFGITECLPIYSGGLGMLAGDHLKSASELGVPLVGVGLLYQKGYFRQYLNAEGWQQERYPINDFHNLPLQLVREPSGAPLRILLDLAGRTAQVQVWRVQVGRVALFLLDTNVPENPRDIQDITDELYGGDTETRIRQEVVLGIGGMRALLALDLRARVYHMNEGHSAFVALERLGRLMQAHDLKLRQAWEIVRATTVFTTHTPVPAGIDVFQPALVEQYLGSYLEKLGAGRDLLLDQGRLHPGDRTEPLNMAVTALRLSGWVNGVSRLHGKVARAMWHDVWPAVPVDELPIAHVTNGIHPGSWISDDMRTLYDRYLGPRWSEEPGDTRVWQAVHQIPGEELWRTHERRRERLVAFARRRLVQQLRDRGAGRAELAQAEEVLNPEALTIGFARRFATYKRATLILRDAERLAYILNNPARPVQLIFAGKAHPKDDEGKQLIRDIVQFAARPEFRRHIVFLEDYDASVARYLVQGTDVWLNTPRRPREASGTSGMKALFNGVLNLSILDGWWDEAYSPRAGWAIGGGEEYSDLELEDRSEAGALYQRIEREVVPLFYERGSDHLPRGWIERMKTAMEDLCPVFNTNRMVWQYLTEAYLPGRRSRETLEADDYRRARALAAWRARVVKAWPDVVVVRVAAEVPDEPRVGSSFPVLAWVRAPGLEAADLAVQVVLGGLDDRQQLVPRENLFMEAAGIADDGSLAFSAAVPCRTSGMQALAVRVLPRHEDLTHPHQTGLVVWAS